MVDGRAGSGGVDCRFCDSVWLVQSKITIEDNASGTLRCVRNTRVGQHTVYMHDFDSIHALVVIFPAFPFQRVSSIHGENNNNNANDPFPVGADGYQYRCCVEYTPNVMILHAILETCSIRRAFAALFKL